MSRAETMSAAEIKSLMACGMTVREASDRMGVAPKTLWRWMKTLGIKRSGRRAPQKRPGMSAALAAMRDGARTAPEIAERLGRPTKRVTVMMIHMEERGLVARRGMATPTRGRPATVWKIVEAAQ